jgi:hypothetical protein
LGVLVAEVRADLGCEVVVDDVFEVHLVKVVGPGVEHGEALVLDLLLAVLFDVLANEIELSLVGANGVGEVVLRHYLFGVADKGTDGPDARGTLEVLVLDLLVNQSNNLLVGAYLKRLKEADENLLEALQVPVLVDSGVDDAGSENLLGFHGE